MMDWNVVAATAIHLVTIFLTKAGEEIAEKTGEHIFVLIKEKLKGDKEARNILNNFTKKPVRYKGALIDIVREKAETDLLFGERLRTIIQNEFGDNSNKILQIADGVGIAQAAGSHSSATSKVEERKK